MRALHFLALLLAPSFATAQANVCGPRIGNLPSFTVIDRPQAAAPTFSPAAGSYGEGQVVTISTTAGDGVIRYTTDGSDPTSATSSCGMRSCSVTLATSSTLRAITSQSGMSESAVASAAYTVTPAAARNAVLYAPFATPGCYATGSTALAVDGTGTPVAVTVTRASVANLPTSPTDGGWAQCASGQARVGPQGFLREAEASQQIANVDSPNASGGWVNLNAGTSWTQNGATNPWIDGTSSTSYMISVASALNGLSQTIATTAGTKYAFGCYFNGNLTGSPLCAALGDGTNAWAKFSVYPPKITYQASSSVVNAAGVEAAGRDWIWAWVEAPALTTSTAFTLYLDQACTDGTRSGTTSGSQYLGVGKCFVYHPNNSPASTYVASSRAADRLSVPINVTDGNVTLTVHARSVGLAWGSRAALGVNTPLGAAYPAAGTAIGQANSIVMGLSGGSFSCSVYDTAGAVKTATVTSVPSDPAAHVFKCGTTAAGAVTAGIDGATQSATTGAGTGIISAALTTFWPGQVSSNDTVYRGPLWVSHAGVCNTGSIGTCGTWNNQDPDLALALGDSITQSNLPYVLPGDTWTVRAATVSGTRVMNHAWDGAKAIDALGLYPSFGANDRPKKVSVLLGINDLENGYSAARVFDSLQQLYRRIIASGATPVPMHVLPTSTCNAACQVQRAALNASIVAWGARNGVAVADCATGMDNGSGALAPDKCGATGTANCSSVDNIHPSPEGMYTLGNCMAPYFQ